MELERTLYRVPPGHEGRCRCGLMAAYFAVVGFESRNKHGLRTRRDKVLNFCTVHGRAYAAKFHAQIREGGYNNATNDKPNC